MGVTAQWHTRDALEPCVSVPAAVEKHYGRTYDHMHLEIRYRRNAHQLYQAYAISGLRVINPLQLFKPLYTLSEQNRGLKAPMRSV